MTKTTLCRYFWDTIGWPHPRQMPGTCYCSKRDVNFDVGGNLEDLCSKCSEGLPVSETNLEHLVTWKRNEIVDVLSANPDCTRCRENHCYRIGFPSKDMRICREGNRKWLDEPHNPAMER